MFLLSPSRVLIISLVLLLFFVCLFCSGRGEAKATNLHRKGNCSDRGKLCEESQRSYRSIWKREKFFFHFLFYGFFFFFVVVFQKATWESESDYSRSKKKWKKKKKETKGMCLAEKNNFSFFLERIRRSSSWMRKRFLDYRRRCLLSYRSEWKTGIK